MRRAVLAAAAVVSLALTYVRAVSGSLLTSLALHVAFNALTVLVFATGQAPLSGSSSPSAMPVYGATVA